MGWGPEGPPKRKPVGLTWPPRKPLSSRPTKSKARRQGPAEPGFGFGGWILNLGWLHDQWSRGRGPRTAEGLRARLG